MSRPEIGAGDIAIELDGEDVVLRPSLKAATSLSRGYGGIVNLINKCGVYDFDTIVAVVTAGLGVQSKDIPDKCWRTGMIELAPMCIRYLHVLANGGRAPAEEGAEDTAPLTETSSQ